MDGARRQGSLRVSSSVAEGVLTPAALHLRVSAEVERQNEGRGGAGWGWGGGGGGGGKRAKMSQTSFQFGDRKPSSSAKPSYISTAVKYYPGACVKVQHPGLSSLRTLHVSTNY